MRISRLLYVERWVLVKTLKKDWGLQSRGNILCAILWLRSVAGLVVFYKSIRHSCVGMNDFRDYAVTQKFINRDCEATSPLITADYPCLDYVHSPRSHINLNRAQSHVRQISSELNQTQVVDLPRLSSLTKSVGSILGTLFDMSNP